MLDLTNYQLHTKDGRKIGNALCVGNNDKTYLVVTDYGNETRLDEKEITELFYIGPPAEPDHKYYTSSNSAG